MTVMWHEVGTRLQTLPLTADSEEINGFVPRDGSQAELDLGFPAHTVGQKVFVCKLCSRIICNL